MRLAVPCLTVLLLAGCTGTELARSVGLEPSAPPSSGGPVVVPRPEPPPANVVPLPPAPFGPAAAGNRNCNWNNSLCQVQECKLLLQDRAAVAGAVYADLSLGRPSDRQLEVKGIAVLAPAGRGNAIPFLCSRAQGQPMTVSFGDRFDWSASSRP